MTLEILVDVINEKKLFCESKHLFFAICLNSFQNIVKADEMGDKFIRPD